MKKLYFKIQVAKDLKLVKAISRKYDRYNNILHSQIKYEIAETNLENKQAKILENSQEDSLGINEFATNYI